MGTYKIDSKYMRKVEEQFERWSNFLNSAIGVLSFTLGLASLGTPVPWINALFSLIIVIYVWKQGRYYFPKEIEKLREKAKGDEQAELVLNALISKHLNSKRVFKVYLIYWFGFIFLSMIAISPLIHYLFSVIFGSADWFADFYGLS
ncbi:hypothetical protein FG168_18560 [Vibrio cholerae]|nr:hypothetical protein [Vibrio cholerae]EKF9273992.1 hypothetical protein [Vibrio cholerae]EKF9890922.1 hypothetical protein [Vibrio cholerae]